MTLPPLLFKVSLQGQPKLARASTTFDYVFGPADENEEVFRAIGSPLVQRAKDGQVGVVFAYGQTGAIISRSTMPVAMF